MINPKNIVLRGGGGIGLSHVQWLVFFNARNQEKDKERSS